MRNGKWIVIESDGEFDIRLLEMIGATSKTGEEGKIGIFGSGGSYAVAAALRVGVRIVGFSGDKAFVFKTVKESTERGDFNRIAYSQRIPGQPPKLKRLSLTDQFGAQHWSNSWAWYVIREFYSNALDEGGASIRIVTGKPEGAPGLSRFWMSARRELVEIVKNLGEYFRPYDVADSSSGCILLRAEGKGRIYRRGVFVQEVEHAYFDYDLHNLKLNESRTADRWNIGWEVRNVMAQASEDQAGMLLGLLLGGAFENHLEGDIDWTWYSMNERWAAAFRSKYGDNAVLCDDNRHAQEAALEVRKKPVIVKSDKWRSALAKVGIPTVDDVVGLHARDGIKFLEEHDWTDREREIVGVAKNICATALGEDTVVRFPIRIYTEEGDLTLGRYFESLNVVGINRITFPKGVRKVSEVLAEEYSHGLSHADDKTRSFQSFLLERLIDVTLQVRGELY